MDNTVKPGRYRHFKGNEYEVLYTAKHSETLEEYVVYRALYGEGVGAVALCGNEGGVTCGSVAETLDPAFTACI